MSLKKNLTYSLALTLSTYLIPVFVYPYVARVLGPSGIGAVDTVESIINYAILVSMMGLTTIGAREVAKARGDAQTLSAVFSSLFSLNVISTSLVLIGLTLLVWLVPQFSAAPTLMSIGMAKVVLNIFWIEWFFKGMELFRYITIRSICLRLCFILAVYLLVGDEADVVLYYVLWVSITAGNALFNWFYRRRFVRFSWRNISLNVYAKPFLLLGLFALSSAVYTQLNVFFLGLSCGWEQVGYYTMATKLYTVIMAVFTSLTTVMIPRMTVLVKENSEEEIRRLVNKTFQLLFLFAFPTVVFMEIFAPEIIYLIGGSGFAPSVLPMRMVMPLIFIIGTEQILMMQVLVPHRKDGIVFANALAGAAVCVLLNLLLLPGMQSMGSAIAWVCAEITVALLAVFWTWRTVRIGFPLGTLLRFAAFSLPYVLIGLLVRECVSQWWLCLLCATTGFALYFLILEAKILKFGMLSGVFSRLIKKS